MDFVVFTSYGNDSIALLQLLHEYRLPEQRRVAVLFSNTGWAAPDWEERVAAGEAWATEHGFSCHRTEAEGFLALARRKKRFPRGKMQFCTSELKIYPAQRWLAHHDAGHRAVCVNGVRRAESLRRRDTPAFVPISDAHGGRPLWSPLAEFSTTDRDALIERAGFEVLPHRSEECSPCIFSSRADLRRMPESRVAEIEEVERELGVVMFRPKAYAGATGIREIVRWAAAEPRQYKAPEEDADCDSGFCGG